MVISVTMSMSMSMSMSTQDVRHDRGSTFRPKPFLKQANASNVSRRVPRPWDYSSGGSNDFSKSDFFERGLKLPDRGQRFGC